MMAKMQELVTQGKADEVTKLGEQLMGAADSSWDTGMNCLAPRRCGTTEVIEGIDLLPGALKRGLGRAGKPARHVLKDV